MLSQQSKDFLIQLLTTETPSGEEWAGQKNWCNYIKAYADKIEIDEIGNAVAIYNPDASFKVLLAGHADEISFMVKHIDENGYIYVEKSGGISPKVAIGMKARVFGKKVLHGVFGVNAEHHGGVKDSFSENDLFLDVGAKSKAEVAEYVSIGDYIVYDRQPINLLQNRLSGRGLDNRTGQFIVAESFKRAVEKGAKIGIYAASTVNEETNMGGAHFVAARYEPTLAIACDVTFATDYPGVNRQKHGFVTLDGGPVLAKGAPVHSGINKMLEKIANEEGIPLQYELTPRMTGTDADKMRVAGKGVPVALVSLSLRYMHSPVETASFDDIEKEIELLVAFLCSLSGDESLIPYSI
ncbi:MAG: M20/M25/M40 family metallo-hydrolase [Bacillaceae bacterium]